MPALYRAVAHADRPGRAERVGEDLDLDVPRIRQQLLYEDGRVAEGLERFGSGTGEGVGNVFDRPDLANASATAAGRSLDQNGESEPFGVRVGLFDRFDGSVAPGSNGDADRFCQPLCRDLVAQQSDRVAGRPDEHDAHASAEIGEVGLLGHEAPPDPGGVDSRLSKRLLDPSVVQVPALPVRVTGVDERRRAEAHGFVRLADEHRVPVRVREEGDRPDRQSVHQVVFADRVDEPHGGFTAVDDREPFKVALHDSSERVIHLS